MIPNQKVSPSNLYIVNTLDRPCERHIAMQRPEDDTFWYVHDDLRRNSMFFAMTPNNPTPIEDFGFDVEVRDGSFHLSLDRLSVAFYSNGRRRLWQGTTSEFSLSAEPPWPNPWPEVEEEVAASRLKWIKLTEISDGADVHEVMGVAVDEGIAIVARWTHQIGGTWRVRAMDTEGCEWQDVLDFHEDEVVPAEPPKFVNEIEEEEE